MKEEDADWLIYHHIIAKEPATSTDALIALSGLDPDIVGASIERLERYFLIEKTETRIRALTFGESLILNQAKYSDDLPFVFENGVVKEKRLGA